MRKPLDQWDETWNSSNPFGRDTTHDNPNFYPHASYHLGDDFGVPSHTPVFAPCDGDLLTSVTETAKGNVGVFVFTDSQGNTWGLEMCHLAVRPSVGSYKEGDVIAYTDNTGTATTAPHFHCCLFKDGLRSVTMKKIFSQPAGEIAHHYVAGLIQNGVLVSPRNYFNNI